MNRQALEALIRAYCDSDALQWVDADTALSPEVAGLRMYDLPLVRIGHAADPLFGQLAKPEAIGPHFMPPAAWLPGAQSVISVFFPATADVRTANARDMQWPADAWLHARIEGQRMIAAFTGWLRDTLTAQGYGAVAPSIDPRFKAYEQPATAGQPGFSSTWSERHVGYVCGMGTFGLSKGLITDAGVAGRLTSVITDAALPPDTRDYHDLYDYCSLCGVCARNCPAGAISPETGKDHAKCAAFLDTTREKYAPRYGCGKCQVAVPCAAAPQR